IKIAADPLYQHLLLAAEKKCWRCVESGERPRLFGVEPPRARVEAVRIVDMSRQTRGLNSRTRFGGPERPTSSTRMRRRSSKGLCRRTPRRPSATGFEPSVQNQGP